MHSRRAKNRGPIMWDRRIQPFHSKTSRKLKYLLVFIAGILLVEYFGLYVHLFEKDLDTTFDYPVAGDILQYVEQLKNDEKPSLPPINEYNFTYLSFSREKCTDKTLPLRLVIIVKSAMEHFARRVAIRNSWGFEKRFSDVGIRTVFLLGKPKVYEATLEREIERERVNYDDIVQANFVDTYFNNTIKTMMGFKWAVKYCPNAKFYLFSDDDYYVSIKNVLRFVRNPSHYPEYVEEQLASIRKLTRHRRSANNVPIVVSENKLVKRSSDSEMIFKENSLVNESHASRELQQFEYELTDDALLYSGFVFNSSPHRHKSSKWYVSLDEYPWDMWPSYVSAGAYIISREALHLMYYCSLYTKHFRFDDIFLGLVAKKCDIQPYHCKEFYFYKKNYRIHNYKYTIASHGYHDPEELMSVWNEQRSAGNA